MSNNEALEVFKSLRLFEKNESGYLYPNFIYSKSADSYFLFSPDSTTKEALEKSLELLSELEKRTFIELERTETNKGRFLFKVLESNLPKLVNYSERPVTSINDFWIGRDDRNKNVFIEPFDGSCMSISGKTKSGKSVLLKTILKEAQRLKCEISIYDLKNLDWHTFDCQKHSSFESVAENIEKVVIEMRNRFDFLREHNYENAEVARESNNWNFKKMFIAFDEVGDFFIPSKKAEDSNYEFKQRIKIACEELSRLSRSAEIFICYSQQETKAESLPQNIITNLSIRVCYALATRQISESIFSSSIAFDSSLRFGKGVLKDSDGIVKLFRAAKI